MEVQPDSCQPSNVSLHAAQGLVFRVHGTARIVIEKQAGAGPGACLRQPGRQASRPHPVTCPGSCA